MTTKFDDKYFNKIIKKKLDYDIFINKEDPRLSIFKITFNGVKGKTYLYK